MAITSKITDAVVHQPLRDILTGLLNRNMAIKDVGSVTASDTGLRISTAGSYVIGGLFYNKAASSAAFAMTEVQIPAGYSKRVALCIDSAGSTTAVAGDALTSAQVSAGMPLQYGDVPATKAVIADVVIAAAAAYVGGTTTFSQVISSGGSVTVRQLAGLGTVS